jgi:hypothetical protein
MSTRWRFIALIAVPLLVVAGAVLTEAQSASGGGGTLTRGIAFYGPYSGAQYPAAGTGVVPAGSGKSVTKVLLPAFAIPNSGGGQDENHVVVTIQGHYAGYWMVGAKIRPFTSDYGKASGKLIVWLNKPAPADRNIRFSYMTFGIFND